MNLDDLNYFDKLDSQRMLDQIDGLPAQLQSAWETGQHQPLPEWDGINKVVIAGMGGSAIGGDLLRAWLLERCDVPVYINREYELPGWAHGKDTLVITSSHSGNTEETLSAFEIAIERGCRVLAVTTGGQLSRNADQAGVPVWKYQHTGQPRAAVGFSFGMLLAAMSRLGFVEDPSKELLGTISSMREQQASLRSPVPAAKNPAKRFAGQMMGRWVTIVGYGTLAPVARRWKTQINELAKAWAQFEVLPEADHNTLAGLINPEESLGRAFVLFLMDPADQSRNKLRSELTRRIMMLEGLSTDFILAHGNSPLAHQWTSLLLGDYIAFYLAMAYGVDPSPVPAIEDFKRELAVEGK